MYSEYSALMPGAVRCVQNWSFEVVEYSYKLHVTFICETLQNEMYFDHVQCFSMKLLKAMLLHHGHQLQDLWFLYHSL